MKRILFLVCFVMTTSNAALANDPATQVDFKTLFEEICEIVANNFYDPVKIQKEFSTIKKEAKKNLKSVSKQSDFSTLINKMLSKLNTSHTYYLTPADYEYYHLSSVFSKLPVIKKLFNHKEIMYPSVGIITEKINNKFFIASVLSGSVAEKAGLFRGDEIISVNGKPFSPVKVFENNTGKSVKFMIKRTQFGKIETISATPVLINPKEEMLEAEKSSIKIVEQRGKKIGYIHIYSYAAIEYHKELIAAITWGKLKDADALIIDLRYGLGGANTSYLNIFNPDIPVLHTIDKKGNKTKFDSQWRKPAVYLVNKATRSGKELLAFGAKAYKFATVIGERTAGAATAGRLFPLSNGDLLYLAVLGTEINGVKLEGVGVAPDIEVPVDIRYSSGKDIQLEKSINYLMEELLKK